MTDPAAAAPGTLPDVNVLLALTNPAHQHHRAAHDWLRSSTSYRTTPVTEIGLLRLLMNRSVTGQSVTTAQALAVVRAVRADERAVFLPDQAGLSDAVIDLIGLSGHRQVTDLHLVDLAARNACTLVTFDRRIAGSLSPADRHHVRTL